MREQVVVKRESPLVFVWLGVEGGADVVIPPVVGLPSGGSGSALLGLRQGWRVRIWDLFGHREGISSGPDELGGYRVRA